ncbi:uncharacterized protein LOC131851865 [Achroia grisella]|uniref:uncharacterized protein LOC131851865 n=1 Tax=Achroia grisella TaxID=688607 RepID=UPI0027D3318C|nr:uncharacterized protein LOC131851865 [Achroia grisella]
MRTYKKLSFIRCNSISSTLLLNIIVSTSNMFRLGLILFLFVTMFNIARGIPILLKGSSPSGDAVVTISSNDPQVVKYIESKYPSKPGVPRNIVTNNPEDLIRSSFSFAGPGHAVAGTGRSIVSAASLNSFVPPLFFAPLNLDSLGLGEFGQLNNWFRGVNGFPDTRFGGNGEINTVAAINDNGHIYRNVKTVTFNRPKRIISKYN